MSPTWMIELLCRNTRRPSSREVSLRARSLPLFLGALFLIEGTGVAQERGGFDGPRLRPPVIVVDDDGPADHASLLDAVAAAPEGALVLVRSGNYPIAPELALDGKSLAIVADDGANVRLLNGRVRVSNLARSQTVWLDGVEVDPLGRGETLVLEQTAGVVWVEDCRLRPWSPSAGAALATLAARRCAALVLVRSSVRGTTATAETWPDAGCHGILAAGSRLHLFEAEVVGGGGWTSSQGPGGPGGEGVRLEGSWLLAAGSTLQGGTGGLPNFHPFLGCLGGSGGIGGAGIRLLGDAPEAHLVGTSLLGGPGGFGGGGPLACPSGDDGPASIVENGTLDQSAARAHGFEFSSFVRPHANATATFQGTPGERVWLLASSRPAPIFLPLLQSSLVIGRPIRVFFAGTVDASGALSVSVPVQRLLRGAPGRVLHAQALFHDPTLGFSLSSPSISIVLDRR